MSEKKNKEVEDLQRELKKLQLFVSSQWIFWTNALHNLKNQFTTVNSYAELLNTEGISEAKRKMLVGKISEGCYTLTNYLWEMLCISRVNSNLSSPDPKVFNISRLVSETLGMNEGHSFDKDIKLKNLISEQQEVYADYDMIYNVMNNLIGNALKFTPNGGSVEVSGDVMEGGMFQVRVKDSGVGIDLEKFDMMMRDNKSFTTKGTNGEAGTGLGLLICRAFVTENHGKFWAERNAEGGSTLSFTVPVSGRPM
ncbi:MAG: HAMP domain-containing histidine kinase [Bacteroidales bacterium]|nr:HAMP domain-containing histidine kinase [Bacteroidales bacterium]